MLMFSLPKEIAPGFLRGVPATVKINGVPRQLTFHEASHLVRFDNDQGPQARKLIATTEDGDLVRFACAAADGSGVVMGPDGEGNVISVTAEANR